MFFWEDFRPYITQLLRKIEIVVSYDQWFSFVAEFRVFTGAIQL